MSVKHTPSPWRIKKDLQQGGAGISIWGDGTGILAFLTSVRLDSGRLSANEADAALIAAAPTMLAVLEGTGTRLESVLESRRDLPVAVRHVLTMALEATRAAIAAARGGE